MSKEKKPEVEETKTEATSAAADWRDAVDHAVALAQRLGVAVGTSKAHLHRARRMLRELLER